MSSNDDAPRVSGAPETIWLCYGDLEHDDTHDECVVNGEVTWCDQSQGGADVRYVRADVFERERASRQASQIENEALKAERARSGLELHRAVCDERERCAVVCESGAPWSALIEWWQKATKRDVSTRTALECAAAIRRPEPSNGWPDTDAERSAGMCGKCGHPEACAAMGCKTPNCDLGRTG